MRRVVLPEHGKVVRWKRAGQPPPDEPSRAYLEDRLFQRLQRFDRVLARRDGDVFSWSVDHGRAKQWVGVIQLPGLQLEILPKTDAHGSDTIWEARRNLLYMLALAGDVPVRSREVARLAVRRAPLSETLAAIFASRLLAELLCGPERGYLNREENLRAFKGKLLVAPQVLHNVAHRERFVCGYDELSDDTPMNRVFKAACRLLLGACRTPTTQDALRYCLLALDGVEDVLPERAPVDEVTLHRQNERFRDVFEFCRLVLAGASPTTASGGAATFSLLFDMNHVFERFVAAFLQKHVMPRFDGCRLFPQARRQRRHLMQCDGRGVLALRPDLLLHGPADQRLVIDTKWKSLAGGAETLRGGVSAADLYQLHAYTTRYGCNRAVLLYPEVDGCARKDFELLGPGGAVSNTVVCVRFVNVNRNLHVGAGRAALADELEALLLEGLGLPGSCAATEGVA